MKSIKHTKSAMPLRANSASVLAQTGNVRRASTIARVAVQLAREDAGQYMTPKEIAAQAIALITAAFGARRALAERKCPKVHFAAAHAVVQVFGGELVPRGDVDGMVVGVKWASGRFTSGAENVFFVS